MALYNERIIDASDAIYSILNQDFRNLELIVVLDNPQNRSLEELLKKYSEEDQRIIYRINDRNIGLPESLNRAIDIASGTYIARMDGDDISYANRLSVQLHYLQNHKDIDILGCDVDIIDETSSKIGEYRKLQSDFCQRVMAKNGSINIVHPTWFARDYVFKRLKYRNFWYVEDYDFIARAIFRGYKIHNLSVKLLATRIFQNSIVSISRTKAYEQFYNAKMCRKTLRMALNSKTDHYPEIPKIQYSNKELVKYNSCVNDLNILRTCIKNKNYFKSMGLITKILFIAPTAITQRVKVAFLKKILTPVDFFLCKFNS